MHAVRWSVLDDPVLYVPLVGDEIRTIGGVKGLGLLAVDGEKESGRTVGIPGFSSCSVKYSRRTLTGCTDPNQGRSGAGSGGPPVGNAAGTSAAGVAVICASARFGSFSPPWPVSTVRVANSAVDSAPGRRR